MRRLLYIILLAGMFGGLHAQDTSRTVWLSGRARGVIYGDKYAPQKGNDSITPARLNSGHTLVDLSANIKPNDQTYINATVRVRNDYGGFWGGGVTFDLRQLYVKGLISHVVRYQLGDINYKLTPYTFYNSSERNFCQPKIFDVYNNMLHYDMFYYKNNTWRQQGAAVDFALQFSKLAEELQFNFFATRQNPTNFANIGERIFYGGNVTLLQSKYLNAGVNYAEMMDVAGTSSDTTLFHNQVLTGVVNAQYATKDWHFVGKTEFGNSANFITKDTNYNRIDDYFYDFNGRIENKKLGFFVDADYKNVGPKFRSPGAQSLRFNYAQTPAFLSRYGKNQDTRPISMIDFLRDASLYNYRLSPTLQVYLPRFGNAQPYGTATPNRKGYTLKVGQKAFKKWYDWEASYQNLSEIVGQGTTALRNYKTVRLNAEWHISKMMKTYRKTIDLQVAYWNENTTRKGNETFENVDFTNTSYSIGAEVETISRLSIMWGYMSLKSSGFESVAIRNSYGQVTDFSKYGDNISESINAFGLKYAFSENSSLQFNWQHCLWTDVNSLMADYQFNQFALMYNLKF
ncbi:hypothetical protein GC194_03165 [bacterium]|nr:hypothetical protein [bacterium]